MVYISYGLDWELFQSIPEEIAPLFSFEVTYCYLVIQTSHSFFKSNFLEGTLPGCGMSANSTFKSLSFPEIVLFSSIASTMGKHLVVQFCI